MKNYLSNRNNDLFGFNLFDDVFNNFFSPSYSVSKFTDMKTDVKETENAYIINVDMAGYQKEDIKLSLKDGYLTVSATRRDAEEDENSYVRRERSSTCSRSYYVGKGVEVNDVKAKYTNGTLSIDLPKKKEIPSQNDITIE
ncbi:MAG: Hsp20/alpha crystallin family protein [Clostridia bacterium]|nr:Hsp20/alpha crystallin family protein [Clostridia bacterium]